MTVKELIAELKKLPQDLPVAVFDGNERYSILKREEYEWKGKTRCNNFLICTLSGDPDHYEIKGLIKDGLKMGDKYVKL